MRWSSAAHSSSALCGGMLVAMPTAMPAEPLARRFGNAAGSTDRLLLAPVVVGAEIDRVLVDALEKVGRGVAVMRASV